MRDQFPAALKEAMKAGDKPRVAAVRLIEAALKSREIELRGEGRTIADSDVMAVLQKMVKSRRESLEIYVKAGREDLAAVERSEIAVIETFLPKALGAAEIDAAIREAIAAVGATGIKDMGKVVAALKAKFAGQMDLGAVSGKVKAALGA
ncbi:MAG: GatB/YqeY domain-containing protein [Hyphomicrobiales bacterium]|nr:GatB/YqeY domain-containing protein [Hyphomicrobiales bacterium]MDE2017584.1 GatB/YqeY domain-containing protein [Hyphomicrobiales bacterium]